MPEHIQHLYGCSESDIDDVARRLGNSLSLTLEPRDSVYWGAYYIDNTWRFSELRFYRNSDPLYQPDNDPAEDQWLEPDHRDYVLLPVVHGSSEDVTALHQSLVELLPTFELIQDSSRDTGT